MNLKSHLDALRAYASEAKSGKLPQLDRGRRGQRGAERLSTAAPTRAASGAARLPVAIDQSGRLADGYGVQDEPWIVLVSHTGTPLWYQDISTSGWTTGSALIKQVRAALDTKSGSTSPAIVKKELAGSPAPLAALHAQSDKLLGGDQRAQGKAPRAARLSGGGEPLGVLVRTLQG